MRSCHRQSQLFGTVIRAANSPARSTFNALKVTIFKSAWTGRGCALDNAFVERLWRSMKYEEVYFQESETPRIARQGLSRYFDFYNFERSHQSLVYRTPAEVCFGDKKQLQFVLSAGRYPP